MGMQADCFANFRGRCGSGVCQGKENYYSFLLTE